MKTIIYKKIYEGDLSQATTVACQKLSMALAQDNLDRALKSDSQFAILDVTPMYIAGVYTKMAYDDGRLMLPDFYRLLCTGMASQPQIDHHLVLVAPPETIAARVAQRGRQMENDVPADLIRRMSFIVNDSFVNLCDRCFMVTATTPAAAIVDQILNKFQFTKGSH